MKSFQSSKLILFCKNLDYKNKQMNEDKTHGLSNPTEKYYPQGRS